MAVLHVHMEPFSRTLNATAPYSEFITCHGTGDHLSTQGFTSHIRQPFPEPGLRSPVSRIKHVKRVRKTRKTRLRKAHTARHRKEGQETSYAGDEVLSESQYRQQGQPQAFPDTFYHENIQNWLSIVELT